MSYISIVDCNILLQDTAFTFPDVHLLQYGYKPQNDSSIDEYIAYVIYIYKNTVLVYTETWL